MKTSPFKAFLLDWDLVPDIYSFLYPVRKHDLSDMFIRYQLILGIVNDLLEADILAKAVSMKTVEQNVNNAEPK